MGRPSIAFNFCRSWFVPSSVNKVQAQKRIIFEKKTIYWRYRWDISNQLKNKLVMFLFSGGKWTKQTEKSGRTDINL